MKSAFCVLALNGGELVSSEEAGASSYSSPLLSPSTSSCVGASKFDGLGD